MDRNVYKLRPQGTRKSRKRIYNVSNKEPRGQEIKCESTRIHMRGGRKEARGGCENIRKQRVLALQAWLYIAKERERARADLDLCPQLSLVLARSLAVWRPSRAADRSIRGAAAAAAGGALPTTPSFSLTRTSTDRLCVLYILPPSEFRLAGCVLPQRVASPDLSLSLPEWNLHFAIPAYTYTPRCYSPRSELGAPRVKLPGIAVNIKIEIRTAVPRGVVLGVARANPWPARMSLSQFFT